VATTPRAGTRLALAGLLLGLVGVVSYFVLAIRFGARLPEIRNSAWPNLLAVAAGLALSVAGARRGRVVARGLGVLNVALVAWFAWVLYAASAVPPVDGPALGTPLPEIALASDQGGTVRLADFRGAPLLLVFYRGHW